MFPVKLISGGGDTGQRTLLIQPRSKFDICKLLIVSLERKLKA